MRKSISARSLRPIAVLALLSLSACGSDQEQSQTDGGAAGRGQSSVLHSPVIVDGAATTDAAVGAGADAGGAVGSIAGTSTEPSARRAAFMREKAMMRDEAAAVSMPAPPPVAPPAPEIANSAVRNPPDASARQDFVRGAPLPAIDASGAMLVRHGQASIEVKAVDDALTRARQSAAQLGGFIANTAVRSGKDERRSATLEVRVPSAQFDALLTGLSALGKVESVTTGAQDVAEEYVDLGARAANARRVEARLIEMLASRTGKLSDVLTVEQELARVRQEAERYEARIRWLERRASLSSLELTIHEHVPLLDSPGDPNPLAEALARAWANMIGVLAWVIASLGVLIPLGVLTLVGIVVVRRVLRGGTPPGVTSA